ncbi:MAG: HPF/RaiA family ribosome-associated protein [Pirellulaceae bacterium]
MQILLNTDSHITGSEALTRLTEDIVEGAVGRFGTRITRVEVHLADENSTHKQGEHDKRCAMEARLAGLPPITVTEQGSTLQQALESAAETLEKALNRKLGRLDDRHDPVPMGGEPMA